MGSRANAVVIENGDRHVYYSHSAAQYLDALMFWGPDNALAEVRGWRDGREDNPEWDGEWWLDNVWAEGACCIDLDNKKLMLYGGEEAECDILWLETYLKILPYTWPGWSIEWSWGELAQIASYAGVEGEKLEQIDCKVTSYPSGKFLENYIGYVFDIPEFHLPGASALSMTRNGETKVAFIDETSPENVLFIDELVVKAEAHLGNGQLVYDDDEFLMGGIHLDYDRREIWLWRTWDNNIDIELPEYWSGWTLHDCRYDYREFYENVPSFLSFVPRSELSYVDRIGRWVCDNGYLYKPKRAERDQAFAVIRQKYLADNPNPPMLPVIPKKADYSNNMRDEDIPDYIAAHDCCISNGLALQKSKTCACFYCEQIFTPDQIEEWIDDPRGWTALCPHCGIDAVIGDASGYPLTKEFLNRMHEHWFAL